VDEIRRLLLNRFERLGRNMARVLAADSSGEIEQLIAIGIFHRCPDARRTNTGSTEPTRAARSPRGAFRVQSRAPRDGRHQTDGGFSEQVHGAERFFLRSGLPGGPPESIVTGTPITTITMPETWWRDDK